MNGKKADNTCIDRTKGAADTCTSRTVDAGLQAELGNAKQGAKDDNDKFFAAARGNGAGTDSEGNAQNQMQVHSGRYPAMPADPECKGIDCEKETEPMKGDRGLKGPGATSMNFWNPTQIDANGGALLPFTRTADEMTQLSKVLTDKYMKLRSEHIANQELMDSDLLNGKDQAEKDYAGRVLAANAFAKKTIMMRGLVIKATHASKVYAKIVGELEAKITAQLTQAKEDIKKPIPMLEEKLIALQADVKTINGMIASVAVAESDPDQCKTFKTSEITRFETSISLLTTKIKDLTTKQETTKESISKFDLVVTKVETSGKAVNDAQTNVDLAAEDFSKELEAAIVAIKAAETTMFDNLNKAQADFLSGPADGGVLTTGVLDSSGEGETKVVKGMGQTGHVKKVLGDKPSFVELASRKLRGDVPIMPRSDVATEVAAALKKSHGYADGKKEIVTLMKEINEGPIEKVDTSHFSTAMTKVDEMVTTLKDALDCLKDYMVYYQAGSTQKQEIFKTTHAEVVAATKAAVSKIAGKAIALKTAYTTLLDEMGAQKAALLMAGKQIKSAQAMAADMTHSFASATNIFNSALPTEYDTVKDKTHCADLKPIIANKQEPMTLEEMMGDDSADLSNDVDDTGDSLNSLGSDMATETYDADFDW